MIFDLIFKLYQHCTAHVMYYNHSQNDIISVLKTFGLNCSVSPSHATFKSFLNTLRNVYGDYCGQLYFIELLNPPWVTLRLYSVHIVINQLIIQRHNQCCIISVSPCTPIGTTCFTDFFIKYSLTIRFLQFGWSEGHQVVDILLQNIT